MEDEVLLEAYLRRNVEKNTIDFSLRASIAADGRVVFYIHPACESGETADFEVVGTMIRHNRDIGYDPRNNPVAI